MKDWHQGILAKFMMEQKPSKSKVVCTFPGKLGDLLWSLPTMNAIARKHRCKIDVATSEYCRRALRFVSEQKFVRTAFVPEGYVIQYDSWGIQPWVMPVNGYRHVYHLGFKSMPGLEDRLRDCIAREAGIEPLDFVPNFPIAEVPTPYVVVVNHHTSSTMIAIGRAIKEPKVVWLGDSADFGGHGIDGCSADFWLSAGIIMRAEAVITNRSSNAVLAHLLGKSPITIVQPNEDYPLFRIDGEIPLDGRKPIGQLIEEVKGLLGVVP
jgi:hypothetical protein